MYLNRVGAVVRISKMGCLPLAVLLVLLNHSVLAGDVTMLPSDASVNDVLKAFGVGVKVLTRTIVFTGGSGMRQAVPLVKVKPAPPLASASEGVNVSSSGCPTGKAVAVAIPFPSSRAALGEESRALLGKIITAMNDKALSSCKFSVEGHTDAKGNFRVNVALSLRRAEVVKEYLEQQGVDAARLKVQGKGPAELLDPSNPYAAQNRRVQFEVLGSLK